MRQRRWKGVLTAVLLAGAACAGPAERSYLRGRGHLEAGRWDEARTELERAAELSPGSAGAQYALALAYQELGRLADAEAAYRRSLKAAPGGLEVLNNLGGLYEISGRFEEAELILSEGIRLHPYAPSLHNNLGNVRRRRGRFMEAIPEYQHAVRLARSPAEAVPAHANLAFCLLELGNLKGARRHAQAALDAEPGYARAQRALKEVLRRGADVAMKQGAALQALDAGRPAEAESLLVEAAKLDGNDPRNKVLLGRVRWVQGRRKEALIAWEAAWRLAPDSIEIARELGRLYAGIGDGEQANNMWRLIVNSLPGDEEALQGLGRK